MLARWNGLTLARGLNSWKEACSAQGNVVRMHATMRKILDNWQKKNKSLSHAWVAWRTYLYRRRCVQTAARRANKVRAFMALHNAFESFIEARENGGKLRRAVMKWYRCALVKMFDQWAMSVKALTRQQAMVLRAVAKWIKSSQGRAWAKWKEAWAAKQKMVRCVCACICVCEKGRGSSGVAEMKMVRCVYLCVCMHVSCVHL